MLTPRQATQLAQAVQEARYTIRRKIEEPWRVRLVCECGTECWSVHELRTHTVSAHKRGPTPRERTPQ